MSLVGPRNSIGDTFTGSIVRLFLGVQKKQKLTLIFNLKIPANTQGQPQIVMQAPASQYIQGGYQNLVPAVPLHIVQNHPQQAQQQFILIDQSNGSRQLVQMQSDPTPPPTQTIQSQGQTRIASNDSQPVKKVRRIDQIESSNMRGNV